MEFKAQVADVRTYVDSRSSTEPHTRIYRLKVPDGVNFDFKAGQFAMLSHDDFKLRSNPNMLKWTSYSMCSPPSEKKYLEFALRLLDTPGFTHHVKLNVQLGSFLNVRGPYGVFTVTPDPKRLMFVATGSGIAPLMSQMRSLLSSGSTIPITLFYGFKNPDVFLFREELEEMSRNHKNFTIVPTITDAGRNDWDGKVGIFHDLFPKYGFEGREETDVYICGNPKMVEDVKALLPQLGFKPEMIHIEEW